MGDVGGEHWGKYATASLLDEKKKRKTGAAFRRPQLVHLITEIARSRVYRCLRQLFAATNQTTLSAEESLYSFQFTHAAARERTVVD